MKGGAAPVLEDTQHVTYPNLAQIENGFCTNCKPYLSDLETVFHG